MKNNLSRLQNSLLPAAAFLTVLTATTLAASPALAQWSITTVDSTGDIADSSIAIDSNNKVHVAYHHGNSDDLKYATNASGAWVLTTIDSTGQIGSGPSLAIDSNNKMHISYQTFEGDLKYTTNVSGLWVISTLDTGPSFQASGTSIAIDSINKVYISYGYILGSSSYVRYVTNASGSWVFTTIESNTTTQVDAHSSIAIDSNKKAHVVYTANVGGLLGLKYATNASGSWVYTNLETGWVYTINAGPSIDIDSNNKVHMAYQMQGPYRLRYATNASGSWVYTTLVTGSSALNVGGYNTFRSIGIDSTGKAHIVYGEAQTSGSALNVRYATNASGAWVYSTIDSHTSYEGAHWRPSMALDSTNNIHTSYSDVSGYLTAPPMSLKYATNAAASGYVDCGLRMQIAGAPVTISCEDPPLSPLRIYKGTKTYGVSVVDPADANASPLRVQIPVSGIKALRKQ